MKPVFAAISLFILALIVSCGPAKNDSTQTPQTPVLPPTQQQNSSAEAEKSATEVPGAAMQEFSEENNSQVTINPPHGEPGHRCEIPVGAPLEPSPANTTQQATEQSNAEVMLNPRHGEPFHRCDIPVGAPLDSPAANTTRQTTNNQVQATSSQNINTAPDIANNPTAPTIENANRLSSSQPRSTTTTQNSGKINPPHGQPGHRCDIPVGSPLP